MTRQTPPDDDFDEELETQSDCISNDAEDDASEDDAPYGEGNDESDAEDVDETAARPQNTDASPQTLCLSEQDERDVRDRAVTSVRGTADNRRTDAALSRWEAHVHADAALHGGVVPPKVVQSSREVIARLSGQPAPLAPPADTETELNGLIAECRYLMREIAFNSARLTYDPDDRVRFLASAQSMALAAAKVGRTVAQLRGASGGTRIETHRHELVYRHEHTTLSPTPSDAESEKQ